MDEKKFAYGHRWTMEELSKLMNLWQDGVELRNIAQEMQSTPHAILWIVQRLRSNGVPLTRRTKGHVSGRSNRYWTQGEVEYLVRRRNENATNETIAIELGRSECAIQAMVANLRTNLVTIPLKGRGMRRLWNPDALKAISLNENIKAVR